MTGLIQTWETMGAGEHAAFPDTRRYLLTDASQLPINAAPWHELIAQGQVHNVLHGQPEASNPEVCALLCDYHAPHVAALLERHLARRPFAFLSLVSVYPLDELAAKLGVRTRVTLPDDRDGLLRFYDAAVFQTLAGALSASRYQALLSPCVSWTWVRRDGTVGTAQHPRRHERIFYARVDARELDALCRDSRPDAVIAELRRNGRIAVDADPFETYASMRNLFGLLDAQGLHDDRLAYRIGATLAMVGHVRLDAAIVADCIAAHRSDHDALCEALLDRLIEQEDAADAATEQEAQR
ncbi:DUF4123 domain-containing protein [Burkholderia cepacia]|uniref:DUF4123 domain-containing protein n=1 Tax=Burkholderia cepacia GG4 TaxID=1009846 RepID=A0A9W3K033_BURCE|nr:DUF4123 domain-containing protein [Burkholderia cepacia]AFQ48492.1 hypothetical protein GEM_2075 [Burkholderia cepacia GG4]